MRPTVVLLYRQRHEKNGEITYPFFPVETKRGRPTAPEGVSFYLRYSTDGKRRVEPVGCDLTAAYVAYKNRELNLTRIRQGLAPITNGEALVQDFRTGGLTLCKALEKYLDELRDGKSPATLYSYQHALEEFVGHAGADKPVNTVDRGVVLLYKKHLYSQEISETTRHNRLLRVVMFLKHFGIEKVLLKTDWPTINEPVPDAYSKEEIKALLDVANPEEKLLLQFFLYSGARDMEVAHATKSDVKVNGGATLTICAKDGWRTKGKRDRTVPLPLEFAQRLLEARAGYASDALLFPGLNGRPDIHFLRILKSVAKRASIENAELHKFRRTFATMHAAAGTPIHDIQRWLGHRDIKTTLRYLEATASESQAAQRATEAAFGNVGR